MDAPNLLLHASSQAARPTEPTLDETPLFVANGARPIDELLINLTRLWQVCHEHQSVPSLTRVSLDLGKPRYSSPQEKETAWNARYSIQKLRTSVVSSLGETITSSVRIRPIINSVCDKHDSFPGTHGAYSTPQTPSWAIIVIVASPYRSSPCRCASNLQTLTVTRVLCVKTWGVFSRNVKMHHLHHTTQGW